MTRKFGLFGWLFFALFSASAQYIESSEKFQRRQSHLNDALLINLSYNAQFPFGNMKQRFGFDSNFGAFLGYKFGKNWIAGIEGNFLYGSIVKETSMLSQISTPDGEQITTEGYLVPNKLTEMGWGIKAEAGKIIRIIKKLPQSGIYVLGGFGFLQHKIQITAPSRLTPQLNATYKKGYDRMTNGPMLSLTTGFMFLERKSWVGVNLGCEVDLAFTQNRRPWNFDENRKDNSQRLDIFVGIKVGIIIARYSNKDNVDLY